MKNRLDVQKALDANIPTEAVKQRQGSGGKQLDYLPGFYVKQKLSEIFGLYWDFKVERLVCEDTGKTTRNGAPVFAADCVGILTVRYKDGDDVATVIREDYGFGNGDQELANKEAVTDALKRCASSLGNSLGLGLYDPTREGVGGATLSKKDGDVLFKTSQDTLRLAATPDELEACWNDNLEAFKTLPKDYLPHLEEVRSAHTVKLIRDLLSEATNIKKLAATWQANAHHINNLPDLFKEQITDHKDVLKASLS